MKIKKILVGSLIIIMFLSCGISKTINPPVPNQNYKSKIELNKDFESVWVSLVEITSKNIFTIRNIEKSSGLLNLRLNYSGNEIREAIDCGKLISTRGSKTVTTSVLSLEQISYQGFVGTASIFVKRITPNKTSVEITANYAIELVNTYSQVQKDFSTRTVRESLGVLKFNTNGKQTTSFGKHTVTCAPTKKVENTVISALQ